MNPFKNYGNFDSHVYENINKLNKKNDKEIMQGLRFILESSDDSIDVSNIMVKEALKVHLTSKNILIRNLSTDVLYKFLKEKQDISELKELLAIWFYMFVEYQEHKTSKLIYKQYFKVEEIEDDLFKVLNFKDDAILSLKILYHLLVTHVSNKDGRKYLEKYKDLLEKTISEINLHSNVILRLFYNIFKIIEPLEEVYTRICKITAPSLINNKWKMIFEIYHRIPKCIETDAKYMDSQLFKSILVEVEYVDDIKVKTAENLCLIIKKVKNKETYLKSNLNNVNYSDMCYLKIDNNFRLFENILGFEETNKFIATTMKIHGVDKSLDADKSFKKRILELMCKDQFLNQIVESSLELDDQLLDLSSLNLSRENKYLKRTNEIPHHDVCKSCDDNTKISLYYQLSKTLLDLSPREKIIRAEVLKLQLKMKSFDEKILESVMEHSVNVFRKEDLLGHTFKNKLPIILKFQEEFIEENVLEILDIDNLGSFLNSERFHNVLIKFLNSCNRNEIVEVIRKYDFPQRFDLFLRFKLGSQSLRYIDYEELLEFYLNGNFIRELFNDGIFNRGYFADAVIKYIRNFKVPVTVDYTNEFYSKIPSFYANLEIRRYLKEVHEIRNIYKENCKLNIEKIILLVVNEILCINDSEFAISKEDIDLGENRYFLYKIYDDLGVEYLDTQDYHCDDPNNLKVLDIKVRNNQLEVEDIVKLDFSFLSDEGIICASKVLVSYFTDQHNLTSDISDYETASEGDSNIFINVDDEELANKLEHKFVIGLDNILSLLENDKILESLKFRHERLKKYADIFEYICSDISNSLTNNYALSKVEENVNDSELYDFLMSSLPLNKNIFWNVLLSSLCKIRNLNLLLFIEEMVKKHEDIDYFFKNSTFAEKQLFAFIFPSIYSTKKKEKIDLEPLIFKEAGYRIENVRCRYSKTSESISLKIIYSVDLDEFIAFIKIPYDYPISKPTFTTRVEKNSLLNLKISEYLKKTSKFMEVINLWKINIDQKILGVQECLVCYFILHVSDGTFPTFTCIHCTNKFHQKCIQKWILSYNKHTCPLCRQPIPRY